MTWEQLSTLQNAGHEIGSHSVSHEILPLLDDAALSREISESLHSLNKNLGERSRSFCYPNGDFDQRTLDLLLSAGYQCAVTVNEGANSLGAARFLLRRYFIHEERLTTPFGNPSALLLLAKILGHKNLVH
jgi:peptidoglycan/xylan/chitin deacetylase (PgdA/CDA1 family)